VRRLPRKRPHRPLRTKLANGDIVEILTQTGHKPSRDWLNFAGTSRARNKIRHFIHAEEKTRSIELGRRLVDKEARRFGVDRARVADEALSTIATGVRSAEGRRPAGGDRIRQGHRRAPYSSGSSGQDALKEKSPDGAFVTVVKRVLGAGGDDKIKVRGLDDLMVFRARCCNPIRGEKIVGYITRGKGVSVHSAVCPNVVNLLYDPERRIDVEWDKASDTAPYTVRPEDQRGGQAGILADVSSRISDINTNIKDVEATVDEEQRGSIRMTVEISDVKHLDKVMRSLKSVEGVLAVETNETLSRSKRPDTRRRLFPLAHREAVWPPESSPWPEPARGSRFRTPRSSPRTRPYRPDTRLS
jgi:GTP pyrophosphokinase